MRLSFLLIFWVVAVSGAVGQGVRLVVPIGHTSFINAVAFSPDGKMVLTGSSDKASKLWDLSGREIQSFSGHASYILSVAFSPDGKQVLTGSDDKTAKIWDLSGREIQSFSGHLATINSVTFSPDGKYVLTGSSDNTAKLWDLSGHRIRTFSGHANWVNSVAFSPDGQQILTGSGKTAQLWDLNGRRIQSFSGHTHIVNSVAFSPDGKQILTGSSDSTALLWDLNGQPIQSFSGHAADVISVAFSPDGKQVLTGSEDNTTKLWDLSGHEVQSFTGHTSEVNSVDFSPDGKQIFTGSRDQTAKLWDLSGRQIQSFSGHASEVNAVAFSPDGKQVLTGCEDNTAQLWDLSSRQIQFFSGHASSVFSVAFSPDGKQVLTGSSDNTAKLWDLSGRELRSFSGHTSYVNSVVFSHDGKQVLTGSHDNTAKLWDLSGRELQSFDVYGVFSVAFSPDDKRALTGSLDKTAQLWDLSGRELKSFSGHTSFVNSVALSPDGEQVLTGSSDNTAKLWDLSGHELQSFTEHTSVVNSVAFSSVGKQILTGSSDNTAKLWDLSGHEIQSFSGHASAVTSVVFSPNSKHVLTGSDDNTAKLWDTQSGQTLATLINLDSTDWVITTPSGLFDASPGAMKLMYYVQSLDVIELDQLKERYYEPGLLAKIMGFDKGELRNVSDLNNVPLYPEITASIAEGQVKVSLRARSGGMGKLSLFVNGKEVIEDANPSRLATLSIDLQPFAKYWQPGNNAIALRAYNQEGWLKSQAYELTYAPIEETKSAQSSTSTPGGPTKPFGGAKPHLYVLSIGTANYSGDKMDLNFPDLDAAAMATALQSTGSRLFEDRVHLRLLSTLPAEARSAKEGAIPSQISSKANIEAAFKEFAAQAKPQDVLVVYFSGHGITYTAAEKAQFYYLTKDIGSPELSDKAIRDNYTVSSNDLTHWLTAITAKKQVMILDACNSGKVVESLATIGARALNSSQIVALDRMKDRTGMFILTGAAADKVSYEASQYGQGLLTYSLLQGMSGLALTPDKRVDVMTLFQYSRDQVPGLAKGIDQVQVPMLAFPAGGGSFDIGIVDGTVKIPLSQVKPVFIRNNFQDEASFDDVLGLTPALADYFRGITVKGAKAELIYVDVTEYANAYSMKGRYTINGDAVEVRGRLFKGKEAMGEFQATGKKSDVPGLAQLILEKVRPLMK